MNRPRFLTAALENNLACTLTMDGAHALDVALPHWRQAQARIIQALGAESWSGLIAGLSSTVQAVKAH